jgi:hypothetical protein
MGRVPVQRDQVFELSPLGQLDARIQTVLQMFSVFGLAVAAAAALSLDSPTVSV